MIFFFFNDKDCTDPQIHYIKRGVSDSKAGLRKDDFSFNSILQNFSKEIYKALLSRMTHIHSPISQTYADAPKKSKEQEKNTYRQISVSPRLWHIFKTYRK